MATGPCEPRRGGGDAGAAAAEAVARSGRPEYVQVDQKATRVLHSVEGRGDNVRNSLRHKVGHAQESTARRRLLRWRLKRRVFQKVYTIRVGVQIGLQNLHVLSGG